MAAMDDEYVAVSIEEFTKGTPVPYSIYIRLSSGKFLQIAKPGDGLDRQRVDVYREKSIRNLYLTKVDFAQYAGVTSSNAGSDLLAPTLIIASETIPQESIVRVAKSAPNERLGELRKSAEATLELMRVNEVNPIVYETASEFVQSTISLLSDEAAARGMLLGLYGPGGISTLYEHSLGVTLYSLMIARLIGWRMGPMQFKVGMAAMFHDIGTNSIDQKILLKPDSKLTKEETKLLRNHPEWGAEMLGQLMTVPTDIVRAVLQHHESIKGTGYPYGLKWEKIDPLSRVIAAANAYCDLALCIPVEHRLSPSAAYLQLVESGDFDASVLLALKKLLAGQE